MRRPAVFFVGDMLFYGHWGPASGFHQGMIETVRNASLARLFAGGLVGPVAACLCIVGFWHVCLNVRPEQVRIARVMLVAFVVLMVFGSAIHTLWTTRGLAIRYCYYNDDLGCHKLVDAVNSYWDLAYNLGAAPGYLGALLLLGLVLLGKTWYPKWTALANPAVFVNVAFTPGRPVSRPVRCLVNRRIHQSVHRPVLPGFRLHHLDAPG